MGTPAFTEKQREFLAGTRLGFLTSPASSASAFPAPRPVWFELTDAGTIDLFSVAGAPKVRNLRTTPRASLVAANNMGEPEYWVSVVGAVTVDADGAVELAARLGARYWDLGNPERKATLDEMLGIDLVKIVITPEIISSYG